MKFWWVNQNRTWKQEIGGEYMWSPKKSSNNKKLVYYDNMKLVKNGDIIFSYYKQEIGSIGVVTREAYDAIKPSEFGSDGDDWAKEGWMVDVKYKRKLKNPITLKELKSEKKLSNMKVVQKGNRLSITEVEKKDWEYILSLEK